MQVLVYDGSFAGWLTAVFEVYEYRFTIASIVPEGHRQDSLFTPTHTVYTSDAKAGRVWRGLQQYLSGRAMKQLSDTFLSELPGREDHMLEYARYALARKQPVEKDFSHRAVKYIADTAQKVHREKHRMEAFVRFQKTKDDLYFATVEPDFNVLPLIAKHFSDRYADQRWLIYDKKRKYGICYDLDKVSFVELEWNPTDTRAEREAILNEEEFPYQQLWKDYFTSTNIKARKNVKLHIRHMPVRYWKYLTEKQPG